MPGPPTPPFLIIKNFTITGSIIGKNKIGGLIGYYLGIGLPRLLNCHSDIDISGGSDIGGLIGKLDSPPPH